MFWAASRNHERSKAHAQSLGSLWTNLHSLETALRIFLCTIEGVPDLQGRLYGIHSVPVGTRVADDAFTRHTQLEHLIAAFNAMMVKIGRECIDTEIVVLRHALAHGRVTAVSEADDIRLINFKKVSGGHVVVEYTAVMTPEWFEAERARVRAATGLVAHYAAHLSESRRVVIIIESE